MRATLYTDGGSRGNPGPAAIGYVLRIKGKKAIEDGVKIGIATNNQAEYAALCAGLERARREGVTNLQVFMDSQLIVRQIEGIYRVKDKELRSMFEKAKEIIDIFDGVTLRHVKRERNSRADMLVNRALDHQP